MVTTGASMATSGMCTVLTVTLLLSLAAADVGQRLYFRERVPRGEMSLQDGEQLVLDCWAGGSPEPTIHWYHNDERMLPVSRNQQYLFVFLLECRVIAEKLTSGPGQTVHNLGQIMVAMHVLMLCL